MSEYLKPQTPLFSKKNDAYIYPLTHSDQVIMPDGSRLTPDKLEDMILETATPDTIGALSMELLWENANPTSEFIGQPISLGNDDVQFWGVEYRTQNPDGGIKFEIIPINTTFELSAMIIGNPVYRKGNAGEQSIQVYSGNISKTFGSLTINNNCVVPLRVYGFKGVSA